MKVRTLNFFRDKAEPNTFAAILKLVELPEFQKMEPFDQDAVSDTVFMGQDMPWLAERLKFIATPEFAKMPPAEQDAAFLKARLDKTVTSGLAPIDGTAPKKSD